MDDTSPPMAPPDAGPSAIRLRSYQAEMVEESLKQNIIVAMDTGSGKTHVAISRTAAELESCEPDQLVWFLAPTVTLCHQQSCLFEKYLPAYQLRFLSGNDNVDRWTDQSIWDAVLRNVRVVVSTPAVLLDALTHGFVKMTRIALLIYDEAHMCRGNHPASAIMQNFYQPLLLSGHHAALPKILGLTASPVVNAKTNGLEAIERSLNAIAKTPKVHRTELLQFTHRPELVQLKYPSEGSDPWDGPPILATLAAAYRGYSILEDPYVLSLQQRILEAPDEEKLDIQADLDKILFNKKTYVHGQLKKVYTRALSIYNDLGGPATEFYIRSCVAKFESYLENANRLLFDWSEEESNCLKGILSRVAKSPSVSEDGEVDDDPSEKLQALIDLLIAEARPDFTGIVFVEQRATVAAMDYVLSNHSRLRNLFNVGTFVGTSMTSHRKTHLGIGDLVEIKHQQQTLDDFRAGKKNLIIATSVLEEGIDVSNCHIVICYEPPKNLKSFIQRRGRARKQDSKFVIMLPEDSTLAQSPDKWLDLEEEMKEAYLNDLREVQAAEERENLDEEGEAIYRCESTGAMLTLDNAIQHLYHFCAILGGGQHVDLRPRFSFAEDEAGFVTATVTLPTSVNAKVRMHQSAGAWRTEKAARKDVAFQAYIALHKAGLVNDNLLPLLKDADEPDFGEIDKRPAMVQVAPRLDPWIPVARTIESLTSETVWYRAKISIDLEEYGLTSLVLMLPRHLPRVPDFFLHWNEAIHYTLTSEPLDTVLLNAEEVEKLQHSTRALLQSVFGSRMAEERYDFLFLFAPYTNFFDGQTQCHGFSDSRAEALHVYTELQEGLKPPIGLVRQKGIEGHLLMFRGFQTLGVDMTDTGMADCHENSSGQVVHISFSGFPKRRDFLHPMLDQSQCNAYTKVQMLPAKDFLVDRSPASYSIFAAFLPSVLHRYELFMIVRELCETITKPVGFTNHALVLRAVTASSTNELDYQRVEFLGDCILKYLTAVQLMAEHLHWPESYLTERKDRVVSNGALAVVARRIGLDKYVVTKAFTGTKWRPRYVQDVLLTALAEDAEPSTRPLSTKTLADVVESLIGAAFVEGGIAKAHVCAKTLLAHVRWIPVKASRDILAAHAAEEHAGGPPLHLERVEEAVGYSFRNKHLLLEALTHPSFGGWREQATGSYQRLEFLGDAVLDYLVVRTLYAHRRAVDVGALPAGERYDERVGFAPDELPHYTMHSIRTATVNAAFLAFLCMEAGVVEQRADVRFVSSASNSTHSAAEDDPAALQAEPVVVQAQPVRKALWQFMRHSAPATLQAAQQAAAARHARHREAIWRALREERRYPWRLLAKVGADKFFSDMVEAVLGAVFVDSTGGERVEDGGAEAEGEGMEACEGFLSRIGLMGVLERILADGVDCLHPKEQLGRLAVNEKVRWEWVDVNAAAAAIDGQAGEEGAGRDGNGEGNGGSNGSNAAVAAGGANGGTVFRCRVGVGDRWISGWVEGETRLDAETEAADQAVLILLREGREELARKKEEKRLAEKVNEGVEGGADGAAGAGGGGGEIEVGEEDGDDGEDSDGTVGPVGAAEEDVVMTDVED